LPLHVVQHPLAEHLLSQLRNRDTAPEQFRVHCKTLTTILLLEATRVLPTQEGPVLTPLVQTTGRHLTRALAAVPILRAGLGMLDPVVDLFPSVAVGYIGLERHEESAIAHSYYCKLPDLSGKDALCLDPMLATGGSASQALSLIKSMNPASVTMISVVCAPEGVSKVEKDHPEVPIYVAALDEQLNDRKYIVPGLGDFGDRLFGTL
jgi:uracil phosphoribosyltransferase